MKIRNIENGISITPETYFEEEYLKSMFLLHDKRKVILRGAPSAVVALDVTVDDDE